MTTKQKAEAYDRVREKIAQRFGSRVVEEVFSEFEKSKDERIRSIIRGWIYTRPSSFFDNGISKEDILAWLKKEFEGEKVRRALIDYFEDAHKADENPLQSYGIHTDLAIAWLEKRATQESKVHETKGDDGWREKIMALINAHGQGMYKDGMLSWLENQGEQDSQVKLPTFTFNDILALQCCMETVKKVQEDKELYEALSILHNKVHDAYHLEKQSKQEEPQVYKTDDGEVITYSETKGYKVVETTLGERIKSEPIERIPFEKLKDQKNVNIS